MNRQMTQSKEKEIAREFIARVNPYKKTTEKRVLMDLRAYADYVISNNIDPFTISESTMLQFAKQSTTQTYG